jgi:hypothetical protein
MKESSFNDKKISNSVKPKKSKAFKFYEIDNASSAFQKIIFKYRKKRKHYQKEQKNIAAFIEKARFKAERLETENEYMMKELRNNIKMEQELVALFGPRAKKHYNEIDNINKKFTSKIDKYDFFTPKEMKKLKEPKKNNNKTLTNKAGSLPELNKIIFKGRKTIFSPTLMSKNKTNFFNTYNKELRTHNISSNFPKFQSFYSTATNMKKMRKLRNYKPYNTFDAKDNNNSKIIENHRTFPNKIVKNKKFFNTNPENFRDKIKIKNNNKYFSMNATLYNNKNNYNFNLNKGAYLDNLSKINKQFLKKEKRIINHFRNNDYGCKFSKMEYRYLTKKYFN